MSDRRERLPNRRPSELLDFDVNGSLHTASIGRYKDGRVAEIFLRASKSGTHLNIAMLETAVAVSMALQHGCDLDEIRQAMPRREDGKAEGAVGQLLDLLAQRPRVVT